jgi:cobalt-precorrin-5B (C1)-methyltransferase
MARSGYTLPVFACAAAIAALRCLQQAQAPTQPQVLTSVAVDLLEPAQTVEIPIEQVAPLCSRSALAITRSDPGDNLDLTRHTPVWAVVEWAPANQTEAIGLLGGEGIGRQEATAQPAIYAYAKRLLLTNLQRWLEPDDRIQVTLILPEGRRLGDRTSNAAFGVVEGLSLLGTSGIAQPLSAPDQLEAYRADLQQRRSCFDCLVFCVGENGLDLLRQRGVSEMRLVKTANWVGPLLVEAGIQGVESILLFGYHGKLLKLAGGIFHTHHHVADGRAEILTAHAASVGLPTPDLQRLFASATAEAALAHLRSRDAETGTDWATAVYQSLVQAIDDRAQTYIQIHAERSVQVGTVLFDRQRQIFSQSQTGVRLFEQVLSKSC